MEAVEAAFIGVGAAMAASLLVMLRMKWNKIKMDMADDIGWARSRALHDWIEDGR